ncbi:Bud-site selection protein [Aspergillus steynii IBT 23096]|uniref:Bud-site selection protein n=1 Tax=Aspergillus steynii IBT 23096 TaxID=1392250 RepID=A0A2I2GR61_9EURO|nr:Bud-site selection protein [Aspergillus steynii IBT 23096]PLB55353.1 Bud-site selection protein [Aspergillus steynii IBT 23096]
MPKRKLSDRDSAPAHSLQTIRLSQKFDQGVQLLTRALKTARGFERQKLGRREKTAKSQGGDETLKRLAEEVQVLKSLDPPIVATKYLLKQMLKTKRIAETTAFTEFHAYKSKKVSTEGPKSPAEANVMARLYKSNPVKNVYPDIMTGIRELLGLKDAPAGKKDGKGKEKGDAKASKERSAKSKSTPESAQDEVSGDESGEEAGSALRAKLLTSRKGGDDDADSDQEMSEAESDDFAQFDSRLAPDSGDEDDGGEQSASDDGSEGGIDLSTAKLPSDMSISRSPSPDSPPAKKQKAKKAAAAPITSTTFLPSLSMGGYFSGSESEAEDVEDAAPRRKNRMGQQARRALWEKKFGSGANHVKNQKDNKRNNRDSGWDVRRGATDGREGPRGRRGQGRGGAMGATGANALPRQGDRSQRGGAPASKPEDNKPLHPSWEAAKKAKEQKTASFSGKKVVFD